ncbi:MAG: diacylglycerol kinase [bacterium]
MNTAIEDLCNKVEPEHDPAIGKIKDTMAAFVFVSSIGVSILGILIFAHHFIQ